MDSAMIEVVLIMSCLMWLVLIYGISIERSKRKEARHTIEKLITNLAHCQCQPSNTRETSQSQPEERLMEPSQKQQ